MTDPIGDALVALAERSTGNVVVAGRGFTPGDMGFGLAAATHYEAHGALTPALRRASEIMLAGYAEQLAEMGRSLDAPMPTASSGWSAWGVADTPATTGASRFERRKTDVSFRVEDGYIRAKTDFALKDLCRSVPGRSWNRDLKVWEWPAGPIAAEALVEVFAAHSPTWDEDFQALLGEVDAATAHKTATDLPEIPHLTTTPWLHQRQAYWFIQGLRSAALWMDMGEQPYGAKVLTPSGEWVEFGSLQVGDLVVGNDGLPTRVEECKPWVEREVWRVHLHDGGVVECSPNHLWMTKDRRGRWAKRPLFEIEALMGLADRNRWPDKLPPLAPVEHPHQDLPLDPFVLGTMLGDGNFTRCCHRTGTSLRWASGDAGLNAEIERRLPPSVCVGHEGDGRHHTLSPASVVRPIVHALGLCGAASRDKFIPPPYLVASVDQRKDLLRGLMSTDGTKTHHSPTYSTISKRLAEDVSALARSLGGDGAVHTYEKPQGPEYRVHIGLKPTTRTMLRRIVRIEHTGVSTPMRCIRVSNAEGLYVTDDYVVTSNTGKSLPAVARALDVGGDILIICPSKVVPVWPREFRRHSATPIHVENGRAPKRGGGFKMLTVAERAERFSALAACDCGKPHVYVVNYEATLVKPLNTWLPSRDWDMLIMDEAHKLKSPTGAVSRLVAKVAKRSAYRLQLTGTPWPHTPLDAFGQYRALDSSTFGTSFTSFKARYGIFGGYEEREFKEMNPDTVDEFHAKCYRLAFRVRAGDVLDLPEVLPEEIIPVTLTGPQAKVYKDMESDMYAEFPGKTMGAIVEGLMKGTLSSPNAMVAGLRLRQITGGSLKDEESGQTLVVGDAKAAALAEWMADFPDGKGYDLDGEHQPAEPLVVFAIFAHDLAVVRRVAEEQGRRYGEVSGRRNDLSVDGEYPTDIDVLGVQIHAGGSGVDLTRARYACYYGVDFNFGDYDQSRRRLHRPGQTRPVRFTHLVAEGTVDEHVYKVLAEREDTTLGLLDR